jgi:hypothetical protein
LQKLELNMQSIPLRETPYLGLASIPTFPRLRRNCHASGKLTIPTCLLSLITLARLDVFPRHASI